MRINVYEEELTEEVQIVPTQAKTGEIFYGVRMFYKSHPDLHHTAADDDRSAITLWVGSRNNAEVLCGPLRNVLSHVLSPHNPDNVNA